MLCSFCTVPSSFCLWTAVSSAQITISLGNLCFLLTANFVSWPLFHLAMCVFFIFFYCISNSTGWDCFVSPWSHCNTWCLVSGLSSGQLEVSQSTWVQQPASFILTSQLASVNPFPLPLTWDNEGPANPTLLKMGKKCRNSDVKIRTSICALGWASK